MRLLFIILLFSKVNAYDLNKDTVVSGNWNLNGQLLNISGKITGGGTIRNAIINANTYLQIFDTSIALVNCKAREFSALWYGAKPSLQDNYEFLQKCLDACILNKIKNLYIPVGNYRYSTNLKVKKYNATDDTWDQVALNIYGDGDIWDDISTELVYTSTTGFAFGFQHAKGGSIGNLTIRGQWVPPIKFPPAYYSILETDFKDRNNLCPYGNYRGLVIDWDNSRGTSGSTGLKVHDMYITGFDVLYCVSPNGRTQNADILTFENIQCGDGRRGFESNQPQEKGNRILNITSWGFIHTLINIGVGNSGAGNYIIDGGNVAGSCIRLFNINQQGWFPTYISHIYAESVGRVGNLSTGDNNYKIPIIIRDCIFDLALQSEAGQQTIVDASTNDVYFYDCSFRYYGRPQDIMKFSGYANYINSKRSSPTTGMSQSFNLNYPLPTIDAPKIQIRKR